MRTISILAAMLSLSGLCLHATGSSRYNFDAQGQHTAAPLKQTSRPKLLMQDALKIAEGFISRQHIDISHYWLYQSTFMLLGDEKSADSKKIPGWHFWWVSGTGAMGDYVEIFVTMDGKASRIPSM